MNIRDEAVEAGVQAYMTSETGESIWHHSDAEAEASRRVRVLLEAAAPHMLAGAWDEGHDAGFYARERWMPLGVSRDASESDAHNPHRPTP